MLWFGMTMYGVVSDGVVLSGVVLDGLVLDGVVLDCLVLDGHLELAVLVGEEHDDWQAANDHTLGAAVTYC